MSEIRLTLTVSPYADAEQVASQLIAEWVHSDPRWDAARVEVFSDHDVARERRDADLLARLRQVHLDLGEVVS